MARVEIPTSVASSQTGEPIENASVQVNVRATSAAATVYQAETGTSTHSNPLSTDADGRVEGWLEEGSYALVISEGTSGVTFTQYIENFDAVSGTTATDVAIIMEAPINVQYPEYGAVGDGSTDDSAAFTAAGDAGGPILIPNGTYRLASAVSWDGIDVAGLGGNTIIQPDALGTGIAALTITNSGREKMPELRDFVMTGPGSRSLGVRTANCDGLKTTCQSIFRGISIDEFDSGMVWASGGGHIYVYDCMIQNNYYGVYHTVAGGDYLVQGGLINGATFANFACPADQGFEGLDLLNTHCGFAPYGIYQEAAPAAQGDHKLFLQDCHFSHAHFETIGNAAIATRATVNVPTNYSVFQDNNMEHVGFSWGTPATYQINTEPQDFAVDLGFVQGTNVIDGGAHPFLTGDVNIYRVQRAAGNMWIIDSSASSSSVQIDSGSFDPLNVGTSVALVDSGAPGPRFNSVHYEPGGQATGDFSHGGTIRSYAGTPNGNVIGYPGDLCMRTSGGGANTCLYVKESGNGTNTGWVAK